jgi:hypothetical protein
MYSGFADGSNPVVTRSSDTLLVEGKIVKTCGTATGIKNTKGATGVSVLVPQLP